MGIYLNEFMYIRKEDDMSLERVQKRPDFLIGNLIAFLVIIVVSFSFSVTAKIQSVENNEK